jgi:hypothetical protein
MHKAAKVCEALVLFIETQSFSNIASIYGYCGRVTRRVPVACIKGRDKRCGERQICSLQPSVDLVELLARVSFFTVQRVEAMRRERWHNEENNAPL